MEKNPIVTERRLGKFVISKELFESMTDEAIQIMFSNMLIVDVEHNIMDNTITYAAYSRFFEPVPAQCEPKIYEIVIGRIGTVPVIKEVK